MKQAEPGTAIRLPPGGKAETCVTQTRQQQSWDRSQSPQRSPGTVVCQQGQGCGYIELGQMIPSRCRS